MIGLIIHNLEIMVMMGGNDGDNGGNGGGNGGSDNGDSGSDYHPAADHMDNGEASCEGVEKA